MLISCPLLKLAKDRNLPTYFWCHPLISHLWNTCICEILFLYHTSEIWTPYPFPYSMSTAFQNTPSHQQIVMIHNHFGEIITRFQKSKLFWLVRLVLYGSPIEFILNSWTNNFVIVLTSSVCLKLLNRLIDNKGSVLVLTNHINYEKCIEHWFLAPWVYLCSTSLIWTQLAPHTLIIRNF